MRCILLLVVPLALGAQPAQPDSRVTEALVKEMQLLRLAIERSTLLGARMQLSLSQLQLQETALTRVSQQYNDVRTTGASTNVRKNRLAEEIKGLEQQLTAPEVANSPTHLQLEAQIKQDKFEFEEMTATEQIRSAREGELSVQLQAAQAQIADTRNRIAEVERALDAALQQLLNQK